MDEQKIELINSILDYSNNVLKYLHSAIEDCRKCDEIKISGHILDLSDGLIWFNEALGLTRDVHEINPSIFNDVYKELSNAMQNRDYYLIADIFEYDLSSKLRYIDDRLSVLLQ